jgi:fatty-acid desaturase
MSKKISFFKHYKFHILLWVLIGVAVVVALQYGVDEKIVVFTTLVLGIFTQVFAGLGALIAMIPILGPILIKVVTIPFFWIINALGHGVSIVAIKKGYTNELVKSRVLTISLLIGIVLGYIMGNLIPLQ